MKNYNGEGNVIPLTAPVGGVVSGTPVKIGRFFAIPEVTAAAGEVFSALVYGDVTIPKVTAEPWSEGLLIWWNTGSALASSASAGGMFIGTAIEARTNPSTTGRVLLSYGGNL